MKKIVAMGLFLCMLVAVLCGCDTTPGKSAYELAVDNGFTGTLEDWLLSLKGEKGDAGTNGQDGADAEAPTITINKDGYWVINGQLTNVLARGTQGEKGDKGDPGEKGDTGATGATGATGEKGDKGDTGATGADGADGKTPTISISSDGYWVINGVKSNVKASSDPVTPGYAKTYPYTDADGTVHIRYQDTYELGSAVVSVNNVTINSRVTGTATRDEALFSVNGKTLFATATGRATVFTEDGGKTEIEVEPSPISMLFVSGQSNASGDHASVPGVDGRYTQYVRTKDTMSYFTYTYQTLNITGAAQIANPNNNNALYNAQQPEDYVTPTLKWGTNTRYSNNIAGPHISVFDESSSVDNFRQAGWCAGLANEWVEGTGERVWVVNASHGGHPINNFIPERMGGPEPLYNDYEQAVAVFRLALNTLYREVDAGHFTLSHMAYYWFQGESDSSSDDRYYDEEFAKLHSGMMEDVAYDHNGEYHALEYCGLMTLRSCRDNNGNSTAELYMTGPRISQYAMGGTTGGTFRNVYVVSNVTEKWVGGDDNVKNYFLAKYGSAEAFEAKFGYPMPTTMQEVHPQIHYFMQGQNEMGLDAGRNSLLLVNRLTPGAKYRLSYTEDSMSVRLVGVDGVTEIPDGGTVTVDAGRRFGYIIPRIEPISWMQDGITLRSETPGLTFEGYRLVLCGNTFPSSLEMSVWVGGNKVADYTLNVTYSTSFLQNKRRSHNLYGGDFNPPRETVYDEEASRAWSVGYLDYESRSFFPFTNETVGWLHLASEGTSMWGSWHGGFRSSNYAVGYSRRMGESIGYRYVVSDAGVVGIRIDSLTEKAYTDLAVFVNGKLVWPAGASTEESSETSGMTGWYRLTKDTTPAMVNEALDTLRINAMPGDEIEILIERVMDENGNMLSQNDSMSYFPSIFFTDDATGAITPDRNGGSIFLGENDRWQVGFLSFVNKRFTAFTATAGGGWRCDAADVSNIWTGSTRGAFWLSRNYAIATSPRTDGATAINFKAYVSGRYTLSLKAAPTAAQDSANGEAYMAVFINGELQPFAGDTMQANDPSTWYHIRPGMTLEEINAKLATLSLTITAGDDLTIAFGRSGNSGQVILAPVVAWKND